MKLALSKYWSNHKGKIEEDNDWNNFNGSFVNKEIDPSLFPIVVQKGYAYTAQHNHYRKVENFICSQFLAFDFDTEDHHSSFEELCKNEFVKNNAYFLHTTPSHQPDKPRTRLVFVLDKAIEDSDLYNEMMIAGIDYFKIADKSAKGAARFFYGAKDCEILKLGNILSVETFNKLILEPYQQKQKHLINQQKEQLEKMVIYQPNKIPNKILQIHREKLLEHVRNAGDGEKHYTLLKIATTLGGYIVSGYYDFDECFLYMKDAIISNPHNVKDMQHAFDTIEKSLQHGMSMPLYFEDRYSKGFDNVKPALTSSQKVQIQKLFWQACHDMLTAKEKDLWYNLGFNDAIIDQYMLGYRNRKIDTSSGEILIESAYSVPFVDYDNNVLNVEYRTETGFEYENDYPVLFYTDKTAIQKPMIVLPDSLTALNTYLNVGYDYQVVGLPHMAIVKDTIDYDGAVILLEPDTDKDFYNFKSVREHCRFLRLKKPIKEAVKNMSVIEFGWLLQQAIKW